jgi:alkylhydroperoxidase family enzyme
MIDAIERTQAMSTKPRVQSAIPGEPAHFQTVLAHQPILAERFGVLYAMLWQSDVVPARIKEIARMRNARISECGFCRKVRFDKAVVEGLDEKVVGDITDDYAESDKLTGAEKAALKFTDAIIFDPGLMDGDAKANLKAHFTAEQIAELGMAVTLFLALAKTLITLGLEPESMDLTVLPTPGSMLEAAE